MCSKDEVRTVEIKMGGNQMGGDQASTSKWTESLGAGDSIADVRQYGDEE